MHDAFSFDGHYCMVFESLGPSLYDFLKRHNYQPFPMACVQDFAVQLLETLEFLHSFRLIHTDLKIENILLMNNREVNYGNQRVPESTKIKLIDFGGACYDSEKKSSVINTRQYRAPEVILGVGWSMPSDIWSLGCILAELYQGELLFATHDNIEHLALIERVIGNFPRAMVKAAKNGSQSDIAQRAFDSNGRHRLDRVLPSESASFVRKACLLDHLVRNHEDSWFLGLLRKMLMIDPNERSTAHECLQYLSRIRRDVVRYN
jgi:dual-specificity kinase/CDC-like kinase